MLNPMKVRSLMESFQVRHPKFCAFLNAMTGGAITEGTVLSVEVKLPDGKTVRTNLRIDAEDIQALAELRAMK